MKDSASHERRTVRLPADIAESTAAFADQFRACFDLARRDFVTMGNVAMTVFYIDGLVTKSIIHDSVIAPLLEVVFSVNPEDRRIDDAEDVVAQVLSAGDVKRKYSLDEVTELCLSGDTVVFIDGSEGAIVIQTRGWQSRGIQEPATQTTVRGPREGFTETILFNTALLRRKLKTPKLKMEIMTVGRISKTNVCLAYIEDVAEEGLVAEVRERLNGISVDYVLESGHIEQLIDGSKSSLFSTTGNNEKPDVVAAKLLKGRVAVLTDGTPFVLTMPLTFTESFHAAEDYYSRPYFSNFLRILRLLSYIIALTLPAAYVALCVFHPEMIPLKLLLTVANAREGIPFTTAAEMALMLVLYELLREAILRLPKPVGGAVSIVGVLIIGDAAVSAGIIGAPVVVVSALTFITSAVSNPLADSTAILRFGLLAAASVLGLFGLLAGLLAIGAHVCSLESYGTPYMFPMAPFSKGGMRDSVVRGDISRILTAPERRQMR